MDIELRPERPSDYQEAENMTREAFWNRYEPGADVHYLLHIMRESPAFIPELATVAVVDSKIVGNVIYTKSFVDGDDGNTYDTLCLGPIGVLPEYQSKGIGGRLIAHTKELAHDLGYEAIFLYGDPDYYSRHGFIAAETIGIRSADDKYNPSHQVCLLTENALKGVTGRDIEDSVFEFDQAAAAEFDKSFPPKEALSDTPAQKRFQELLAQSRDAL